MRWQAVGADDESVFWGFERNDVRASWGDACAHRVKQAVKSVFFEAGVDWYGGRSKARIEEQ